MDDTSNQILDIPEQDVVLERRRKLLPWWMKFFCWMFMLFGLTVPFGLVFAILGYSFNLELYGMETNNPRTFTGALLIVLFLIKGAAAFGLWFEKDWGINVARADAILGIIVCGVSMTIIPMIVAMQGGSFSFKLPFELFLLALYLWKLNSMRTQWSLRPAGH